MIVNIGEKIKQRANQLRIGPTELGNLIHTSKQNIYGIYKRKSIDTEILSKLAIALDFDFFQYYNSGKMGSNEIHSSQKSSSQKMIPLNEYQKLKNDYDHLKEKFELLKKVNDLLEKKKK